MPCIGVSLRKLADFDAVEADWDRLLECSWSHNPCALLSWHRAWWQEFGQQKEQLLLGYVNGGVLKGIAPLAQEGEIINFAGARDLCDYMDFLVSREEEEPFYRSLMAFIAVERWGRMELYSIPQESPTLEHLPALAREVGYEVAVAQEDTVPGLALPGSWDEYLGTLAKKNRHELRRKLRRLERVGGLKVYSLRAVEEVVESLPDFFRLLRLSREDKAGFLNPQRERFFRAVTVAAAEAGALRLFFLEVAGERVAAALCFDYRDRRFLYNSGFDPQYGYYSVGLLLKALCVKEAIEEGLNYFDFMRGSEAYKYDLGATDRWIYQMVVARR